MWHPTVLLFWWATEFKRMQLFPDAIREASIWRKLFTVFALSGWKTVCIQAAKSQGSHSNQLKRPEAPLACFGQGANNRSGIRLVLNSLAVNKLQRSHSMHIHSLAEAVGEWRPYACSSECLTLLIKRDITNWAKSPHVQYSLKVNSKVTLFGTPAQSEGNRHKDYNAVSNTWNIIFCT